MKSFHAFLVLLISLSMIYHLTDIAHQEDLKSEKLLVWSDIDWARTAWNWHRPVFTDTAATWEYIPLKRFCWQTVICTFAKCKNLKSNSQISIWEKAEFLFLDNCINWQLKHRARFQVKILKPATSWIAAAFRVVRANHGTPLCSVDYLTIAGRS